VSSKLTLFSDTGETGGATGETVGDGGQSFLAVRVREGEQAASVDHVRSMGDGGRSFLAVRVREGEQAASVDHVRGRRLFPRSMMLGCLVVWLFSCLVV